MPYNRKINARKPEFSSIFCYIYRDINGRTLKAYVDVIDWDPDTVPDDWNKDWDSLSFEERIVLCDKHDVMYMATRID